MTNGDAAIVIEGRLERRLPTGDRRAWTFAPLPADREPQHDAFWFGAGLTPGDHRVWFRITPEAIARMPLHNPVWRGLLLVSALFDWLAARPRTELAPLNEFLALVSRDGEVTVEPIGGLTGEDGA